MAVVEAVVADTVVDTMVSGGDAEEELSYSTS